jgi:hypothetical protein
MVPRGMSLKVKFGSISGTFWTTRKGVVRRGGPAVVCSCFAVGRSTLLRAIRGDKLVSVEQIGRALHASTNCACIPELKGLLAESVASAAVPGQGPAVARGSPQHSLRFANERLQLCRARRRDAAKHRRLRTAEVRAVEHQQVKVNIEVERRAKALDQRHRARRAARACQPRLLESGDLAEVDAPRFGEMQDRMRAVTADVNGRCCRSVIPPRYLASS